MGLVADPSGSPGPVQADSIAVGSAVGAFTLSDLPSIQHILFPMQTQLLSLHAHTLLACSHSHHFCHNAGADRPACVIDKNIKHVF